ncbi:MAG: ABC transporter permease [Oscillospiraceae bacterium]|nr:ABC transporter permease [Oscillospiraceae bacterium]
MKKRPLSVFKKIYLALIFSFMYVPIAVMIVFSFNESKSRTVFTGFTLNWYKNLFQNDMILQSLALSLVIAVLSSVAATILGTAAAVGIFSMKRRPRSAILNLSYIPVINPEIITGVSLMLLFVVFKNATTMKVFGFPTLLIAHITFNVPYIIFSIMPKLRQMDVRMYEAALDLGCNPKQAFFKVILPEIMPGIVSGFLIAITYSIDDFIISYFTSGTEQTLPIAIYSMTRKKVSPEINALSTIMFIVILTVLMIVNAKDSYDEKKNRVRK